MKVDKFRKLHEQEDPLFLANVWDVISAKAAEAAGFEAIGTSSHAIANVLGYEDGENMSFYEMLYMIERIAKSTNLLVSADIESGFTKDLNQLNEYVEKLVDVGVVGINIEDGNTSTDERKLDDVKVLADKIHSIKTYLKAKGKDLFINARIDTYTTEHPRALDETIVRAKIYKDVGADGIFVPLITTEEDIKKMVQTIDLPLNTFVTAKSLDYPAQKNLGVKRISSGNAVHAKVTDFTSYFFKHLNDSKSFYFLF
ncbi:MULTISPECIES: isocitrate lyase/phosphoenolpyruvate mutase family protein [Weeksella]|uniref:isocitrate lyase/PEP mutase family protein n=1 Tax=Weeksella TaxID=1013 RepID=UPI0008A1109F|nr:MULTISPECIES: isocitrate lyase/phosphoenolpyruvate mutase family protein [Weeksella]MDK7675848.1 isocitrate lyase/phosphoenolpyruvate mutase family protein [Weeksella virosa]OFM85341.1 phosphonomutase [Weeksella sp. HMSC059D05]SUP55058.1 Carboxyvinyl-carboxyphosphonate phosphorylmutase [Weeksella virosa]